MKKQIIIEFDDNGDLKIETRGWTDGSCVKDIEWLTSALGSEKKNIKRKRQAFAKISPQNAYLNRGGKK